MKNLKGKLRKRKPLLRLLINILLRPKIKLRDTPYYRYRSDLGKMIVTNLGIHLLEKCYGEWKLFEILKKNNIVLFLDANEQPVVLGNLYVNTERDDEDPDETDYNMTYPIRELDLAGYVDLGIGFRNSYPADLMRQRYSKISKLRFFRPATQEEIEIYNKNKKG